MLCFTGSAVAHNVVTATVVAVDDAAADETDIAGSKSKIDSLAFLLHLAVVSNLAVEWLHTAALVAARIAADNLEEAASSAVAGEAADTAHIRQLAVGDGRGLKWEVLEQA